MNILQKMDFFWRNYNKNNLTWKECLETLDASEEIKGFGFYMFVDVPDLIDWLSKRDTLKVFSKGSSQFIIGETRTGRRIVTPAIFKGLDPELIEKAHGLDDDEKIRQLIEEAIDRDFPVVSVLFKGFYDSVVFRSEVEKDFGIKFPPFSQWIDR